MAPHCHYGPARAPHAVPLARLSNSLGDGTNPRAGHVKHTLSKAVAIGAVCAAALAGSLAPGQVASGTAAAAAKNQVTQFGYKANVFGTKVLVDGV